MPEEFRQEANLLKAEVKAPIWQFGGLGLIAVLISVLIFSAQRSSKLNAEYIANPLVGDVYEFETESKFYSTLMLTEVSTDSIYFRLNEFETDKKTGIGDIDILKDYSLEEYSLSIKDAQAMYERHEIYDISRD